MQEFEIRCQTEAVINEWRDEGKKNADKRVEMETNFSL